jgi:hypothetical protein
MTGGPVGHLNEITLAVGFLGSGGGLGLAVKWWLERGTTSKLADATVGQTATGVMLAVAAENTQLRAENKGWRVAARTHFRSCPQPDDDLRAMS